MLRPLLLSAVLLASPLLAASPASAQTPMHGVAMNGEPELPAGFASFPYANPDAPKGGDITYCVVGTFDNLNPFILKSMRTTARGVIDTIFGNLVFEPLMRRNAAEPFSLYGLLAENIEMDEDRTYAEFTLDADARWSDGKPVTPEDVIFTYETFAEKGRPPYSGRMAKIESIEKTGDRKVKFTFNENADREFPLIVALTPIIPAHAFDRETFDRTTLDPVTGSGAYTIDKVEPGQRIVFKRNPDYWGADVPSMRGFHNYDSITIEYFLNANAQFEAFKKGICSVYTDLDPVKLERDFDFPAVKSGDIVAESFEMSIPPVVSGFVFNTRREKFADPRVRRALSMLYDFGWVNANVYNGEYQRTLSYWQGSELSALGTPANEMEKELLAPYPDKVTADVMDGTYGKDLIDGREIGRDQLREAVGMLREAGYEIDAGVLKDPDGNPVSFEILIASPEQERQAAVFQRTLKRIGIDVSLRLLDDSQIQTRKQTYDFDVMIGAVGFSGSLSPGIEQLGRWGSEAAKAEGSFNLAGVADPAVDAMIDAMLNARDKETYVAAVRALDRLLISGAYMVPMQHNTKKWIAYWNYLDHPEQPSLNGYELDTWWRKAE
ncbi:Oligopeptide-binding protein AppA [Nitratireductor thuwali]|uniref:Oligopeptide-binding protein AppA n=2 Tax=Nitratireductor thuwali TaxID=2267699 RepID=A0ABY5MNJ9_9HYPH|nr:Oligopeptide-binding protein AppA [Nitratireductor thuwali]